MNIKDVFLIPSWGDRLTELKQTGEGRTKTEYREYFDGKHPILSDPDRQDVSVIVYEKDAEGKKIEKGAKLVTKTKKILNYPVQLISTLASFVFGNPPELVLNNSDATPEQIEAFIRIKNIWLKEARLNEHNKRLLRTVSIETNAAEMFFNDNPDNPKEGKIKVMLLSKENGDDFWCFFNDNRDMEAFTRVFTKKVVTEGVVETRTFTEVWTAETYYLLDTTGGMPDTPEKEIANPYGKIPVVYYDQLKPEWWQIENLVDIIEKKESQLSDVNTRVGHAAVKITGELINMPDASADVKVYQIKPTQVDGKQVAGDVSYLESQTAPESVKLEVERTEQSIYKFTSIPDLYEIFKNATNESGKALKIRLFPINIIIDEKMEIYAPGMDRRISILKKMMENITGSKAFADLDISVHFRDYIPEDIETTIDNLISATGNKPVLSQKRAVSLLPLVSNPDEEYEQIKTEASENLGGSVTE